MFDINSEKNFASDNTLFSFHKLKKINNTDILTNKPNFRYIKKNSNFERSYKNKFDENDYNQNIDDKIYITKVPLNVLNISKIDDKANPTTNKQINNKQSEKKEKIIKEFEIFQKIIKKTKGKCPKLIYPYFQPTKDFHSKVNNHIKDNSTTSKNRHKINENEEKKDVSQVNFIKDRKKNKSFFLPSSNKKQSFSKYNNSFSPSKIFQEIYGRNDEKIINTSKEKEKTSKMNEPQSFSNLKKTFFEKRNEIDEDSSKNNNPYMKNTMAKEKIIFNGISAAALAGHNWRNTKTKNNVMKLKSFLDGEKEEEYPPENEYIPKNTKNRILLKKVQMQEKINKSFDFLMQLQLHKNEEIFGMNPNDYKNTINIWKSEHIKTINSKIDEASAYMQIIKSKKDEKDKVKNIFQNELKVFDKRTSNFHLRKVKLPPKSGINLIPNQELELMVCLPSPNSDNNNNHNKKEINKMRRKYKKTTKIVQPGLKYINSISPGNPINRKSRFKSQHKFNSFSLALSSFEIV